MVYKVLLTNLGKNATGKRTNMGKELILDTCFQQARGKNCARFTGRKRRIERDVRDGTGRDGTDDKVA